MQIAQVISPRREWRFAPNCATALALAALSMAACTQELRPTRLDMATTTSLKNSGLLDAVLPAFPAAQIRLHAAGSGRALEMLADDVVDLVITHAPAAEERYLAEHRDWAYRKFAYNRFVVVGPPGDPADVRHSGDAVDAFRRIAASPVVFVSRGDGSGTHEREQALWKAAGVRPAGAHLLISGTGMATALRQCDERQGYILSDEATLRQLQPQLDLVVLMAGDARLLNTYAVVYPRANALAASFSEWLTEGAGRERVANYEIGGLAAFTVWPDACPADKPHVQPCSGL
jgi:tungstate transport system substrate-binding protein